MKAHTPGPWTLNDFHADPLIVDMNGQPILSIDDNGACGDPECCGSPIFHIEVSPANARLIASAPELLEALRVLAEYPIEDFGKENKSDAYPLFGANSWKLNVGHVRAARAALAKAGPL